MAERKVTYTICDVCGKEEPKWYTSLQSDGWTKYKFNRDWRSGGHAGEHDLELCVCGKCDKKSSTMHFLFARFKNLINK